MPLVRLSAADTPFEHLEADWREQCERFGEEFDEFAEPSIEHARKIASENPARKNYAIFALENEGGFDLIAHFNVARLPRTRGLTLRVLWILLAPKYDFEDISPDHLAHIASNFFTDIIALSKEAKSELFSDHIKVHLPGMGDRTFFAGMAYLLENSGAMESVAIRGNWLHMSHTR